MFDIIHKTQPNGNTCAHACLAMVTGMSINDVFGMFGDRPLRFEDEVKFLIENKIFPHAIPSTIAGLNCFPYSGIYLVTVPSLNQFRQLHRVVIEVTCEGQMILHDPADGLLGSAYYQSDSLHNNDGILLAEIIFLDYEILA